MDTNNLDAKCKKEQTAKDFCWIEKSEIELLVMDRNYPDDLNRLKTLSDNENLLENMPKLYKLLQNVLIISARLAKFEDLFGCWLPAL